MKFDKEFLIERLKECQDDDEIEELFTSELRAYDLDDMREYGVRLLSERFDSILDYLEDYDGVEPSEISDLLFYPSRMDGTLTNWPLKSERQMINNYDLEEIIEKSNIYGNELNSSQLHVSFAEDEFREYFSEILGYVQEEAPDLTPREQIIETCLQISIYNDLGIEKYDEEIIEYLNNKRSEREHSMDFNL